MSKSCFSPGFLSQYSLWKLSTFCGYKRYLYQVRMECEESGFSKQSWLAAWTHGLTKSRVPAARYLNGQSVLFVLQCSSWHDASTSGMLGTCVTSGGLQAASHSRVPVSLHNLEHFFTLSHILPLHDFHLNTRLLIAKIQENLAWNKANKMVDKIQPYSLYYLKKI